MDRPDVLKKFNQIVCDILADDTLVLSDSTQAHDVDGWDSMANITILAVFEGEFGVRFEVSEIESFQNVGEIIDATISHLQ